MLDKLLQFGFPRFVAEKLIKNRSVKTGHGSYKLIDNQLYLRSFSSGNRNYKWNEEDEEWLIV